MSDTDRINELMSWGRRGRAADTEELHRLLFTSDSPVAVRWRETQAAIQARYDKEREVLRGQGRMTKERGRYLVLSNTILGELSEDERAELDSLSEKSDCPEAKADRARSARMIERFMSRASRNKARLAEAGVSMENLTPDEERLGHFFGCSPSEVERFIVTRQNLQARGLSTVPASELASTRCDADKERKQQANRKRVAPLGAAATPSHYSDADIETAFSDYRDKHPEATAWEAAQALTRPGRALSRWKGKNAGANCYRRFERLALNRHGVAAADHYATLKKH